MNTRLNPGRAILGGLALAALLSGCGRAHDWRQAPPAAHTDAEASYVAPPQAKEAVRQGDGRVILTGQAEPNSRVRLQTPEGRADGGTVGGNGAWSMPMPGGLGIYGLSEDLGGRVVQAEGYLVILPAPGRVAALLRAGGGTEPLGRGGGPLRITAADFDGGGGAMVSGLGPPGAVLKLIIDGAAAPGEGKVDARGRFFIASPLMLKPGTHQIRVQSQTEGAQADIAVGPAGPISGSPIRAVRQGGVWRVDWITPGGGVQTSLIMDP